MTCSHCGRDTPTASGRCTSCGAVLDGIALFDGATVSGAPVLGGRPDEARLGAAAPDPARLSGAGEPDETRLSAASAPDETRLAVPLATGPRPDVAAEPIAVGHPFGSRYQIIRELGVGGMGAVYQAWDQELSVVVALKVIRPEVASNPEAARMLERRFKQELLLARQVTHKNVVRIHDLGEINGVKYITMPYIDGEDLATILKREGNLPVRRVLKMARTMASGLAAAHAAGVVHRDLKPANIMIDADGEAMIMDFGIARSTGAYAGSGDVPRGGMPSIAGGHTLVGMIVGTVEYMAPEQAKAQPVDHRADIYAFGLILYDMLVGRTRQTRAESALAELTSRTMAAPPSVHSLDPDIPDPVDKIITRCIQPDAAARYQTTAELVADLERLDEDGHPLPIAKRLTRRMVVGALTLFVGTLATTWWLARGPAPVVERPPMSVLIADFDNQTNDPVFNGSIEHALGLGIEGAAFITAHPRASAAAVANQLKPGSKLDAAMALLVSHREGIKVILAGTIAADGSGYRLTVRALDPALDLVKGKPLATVTAKAPTKDKVLEAVGSLASELRGALGDTAPESAKLAAAETVSAASLEAMRAYARAQHLYGVGDFAGALEAYSEAAKLDPRFGRAYSGLGTTYYRLGRTDEATANYQTALKLLDRMTEREKYRTLGLYYLVVSRNYEKAIESFETLVRLYPADNVGHNNLAVAYVSARNFEKAVVEGRKALEIYPNSVTIRTNYAMYAMYAGDFKIAIDQCNTVFKENPSFELALLTVARAKLASGDVDGASEAYGRLQHSPTAQGRSFASVGQADLAMYLGRYKEALQVLQVAAAADQKSSDAVASGESMVLLAEAYQALGQRQRAVQTATKAAEASQNESILFPAARVLLEFKQGERARKIAADLDNMLQRQTTSYARLIGGEIALKHKRFGEAIEALREGLKRHDSWFARYLLGRVYIEAGQFAEGLAEFELCVKRKGEATDVFIVDSSTMRYLPPVYYWLARAHEGLGSTAPARENYERYLKLRADADPPDPLAADAQRRLGSL
jgi:serine/threonine protein kinase/tetratricopeptide (TPR) repeat protein